MKMIRDLTRRLEAPEQKQLRRFALLCLIAPVLGLFSVSMLLPMFQEAFRAGATPRLLGQVTALTLLLVLSGGFELLRDRAGSVFAADAAHRWSVSLYELCCGEGLIRHTTRTPAEAVGSVRGDTAAAAETVIAAIDLAVELLTLGAYAALMMWAAGWAGAATCLLILGLMLYLLLRRRVALRLFGRRMRELRIRTDGMVTTACGAYRELYIDPRRQNLIRRYEEVSGAYAGAQKELSLLRNLQGVLIQNVMQAALFLLLALLLALGVDLSGILPQTALYLALLVRILPGARRVVTGLTGIQCSARSCHALLEELDRREEMREEEARAAALRQKPVTLERGIRVEGLTFRYPGGGSILEDASLEIPAGESTAIIGVSGVGKSTFLDLLLGLLRPQAGQIRYDDTDIVSGTDARGPCCPVLGEAVSYIPQTVYLNGGTVRSNVVFMAEEDEERVIRCLRQAMVWEEVARMPQGLDTLIGENGTAISGGQRQRIALARALYKDFRVLIMDEATAALDLETERAVMDSIRSLRGRTLLMATHHPTLAEGCQHIYCIRDKKFVKVR